MQSNYSTRLITVITQLPLPDEIVPILYFNRVCKYGEGGGGEGFIPEVHLASAVAR